MVRAMQGLTADAPALKALAGISARGRKLKPPLHPLGAQRAQGGRGSDEAADAVGRRRRTREPRHRPPSLRSVRRPQRHGLLAHARRRQPRRPRDRPGRQPRRRRHRASEPVGRTVRARPRRHRRAHARRTAQGAGGPTEGSSAVAGKTGCRASRPAPPPRACTPARRPSPHARNRPRPSAPCPSSARSGGSWSSARPKRRAASGPPKTNRCSAGGESGEPTGTPEPRRAPPAAPPRPRRPGRRSGNCAPMAPANAANCDAPTAPSASRWPRRLGRAAVHFLLRGAAAIRKLVRRRPPNVDLEAERRRLDADLADARRRRTEQTRGAPGQDRARCRRRIRPRVLRIQLPQGDLPGVARLAPRQRGTQGLRQAHHRAGGRFRKEQERPKQPGALRPRCARPEKETARRTSARRLHSFVLAVDRATGGRCRPPLGSRTPARRGAAIARARGPMSHPRRVLPRRRLREHRRHRRHRHSARRSRSRRRAPSGRASSPPSPRPTPCPTIRRRRRPPPAATRPTGQRQRASTGGNAEG